MLKYYLGGSPDSFLRESWKALQWMVSEHCILKELQDFQYEYERLFSKTSQARG